MKTIKHGGGNVMVWASFSLHGVGPVVRVSGRTNQHQYNEILENHMEPFATENLPLTWKSVQDNTQNTPQDPCKHCLGRSKLMF